MSQIRQNFPESCEAGINKQINMNLYSSYVYLSMSTHFGRDDVALPGAHRFFKKLSDVEHERVVKLMGYQNLRGGRVVLHAVEAPAVEWPSLLGALEDSLALERKVNESLLALHSTASSENDAQLCDFLETQFLSEKVEIIKKMADRITNARRAGSGLGEYMFDRETLREGK